MSATVHPVVLCGGSGTRLWPLSRASYPKQFAPIFDGPTLFQRTLTRVAGRDMAAPTLLTHSDFRFIAAEQTDDLGLRAERIVIEPARRNTAPAVCLAAVVLAEADPDAILMVLPADHVVRDDDAFHHAAAKAVAAAADGHVVTFGIRPDRPETGYGYIELSAASGEDAQPFVRFVEKPDRARAEEMVESGRFLWNSGMFVFAAARMVSLFEEHAPEILAAVRRAVSEGEDDLMFFRPGAEAFEAAPDISFDYAIMERVEGRVVPMDCGWNDLGSWRTVWQEEGGEGEATVASGAATAIDCEGSLLMAGAGGPSVVGLGLRNVVAVATGDAILVADMDRTQDVRVAVDALKAKGAPEATEFPRCYRPWGWYETLSLGTRFQVKRIMVKPGAKLSLQSHVHRAEHWVVVQGTARVTVDEDERLLTENQSVYIPLGAVHRLENPGKVPLHLIEVQSGVYLGEDDIVRYEDIYARA